MVTFVPIGRFTLAHTVIKFDGVVLDNVERIVDKVSRVYVFSFYFSTRPANIAPTECRLRMLGIMAAVCGVASDALFLASEKSHGVKHGFVMPRWLYLSVDVLQLALETRGPKGAGTVYIGERMTVDRLMWITGRLGTAIHQRSVNSSFTFDTNVMETIIWWMRDLEHHGRDEQGGDMWLPSAHARRPKHEDARPPVGSTTHVVLRHLRLLKSDFFFAQVPFPQYSISTGASPEEVDRVALWNDHVAMLQDIAATYC